ncbi:MAG: outer membrane beta-barrel protein [Methyloligellaceae bacterium]
MIRNYFIARMILAGLVLSLPLTVLTAHDVSAQNYNKKTRYEDSNYQRNTQRGKGFEEEFGRTVKEASIRRRPRRDYDPIGARGHGFIFYPYASAELLFDDNIFASDTGAQDDLVWKSSAGVKAESDWGRHFLGFELDVEDYRHSDQQSEDHTNVAGSVKGRYDIYHDTALYGMFSVVNGHENRGAGSALSSNQAAEPTEYVAVKAASYLEKTIGRSTIQVSGSVEHFDYDDVAAVAGGSLDQDSRDGYIYKGGLRKSYNFSPGYNLFGTVEVNSRDFKGGGGTPDRDSNGVEARAGVEFEATRVIATEFSIGYLHQDYDNSAFSDVESLALKSALVWNPTQLMTVNFDASRVVSETTVTNASGRLDTLVNAQIDYEILRNVIGSVKGGYMLEDYQGVSREDETVTAGISVDYLVNRRMRTKLYYTHQNRDSNTATFDYEKNIFGGALKVQF